MGVDDRGPSEFERLYGPWAGLAPAEVAALMHGYPGVWWVAGGWALEAFNGVPRHHEDTDVGVLRADLPLLRRHLARRFDVWAAARGALRPLLPEHDPEPAADDVLPRHCSQVWIRRAATEPWELDILLSPGTPAEWVYRRDESITMPLSEAIWEREAIPFLQPEIQLLYKAKGLRPKDDVDFRNTVTHLDHRRRTWLSVALARTLPGHPWLADL